MAPPSRTLIENEVHGAEFGQQVSPRTGRVSTLEQSGHTLLSYLLKQ